MYTRGYSYQPLYRQRHIFAREGVEFTISTLAGWVGAADVALEPLALLMRNGAVNSH
ncbi:MULTISPECIES: transposase [unclassified Serratia (in: enterobacteria)]|uniref:IS66 family transposase n=1 Tax=unclassified Serratia (in: enterobacteria) TaxID=2647522 RepID=UPI0012683A05